MNRREFAQNVMLAAGVLGSNPLARLTAQPKSNTLVESTSKTDSARGVVSTIRQGRKFPLPNVRVSNGRDVVTTDRLGRYTLPIQDGDIVFLTKPRGYALELNGQNLPQFHYIHLPAGSPPEIKAHPGIAPTGPIPVSIDFTLQPQAEPDEFRVLLFGDPQPRNQIEADYVVRDIIHDALGEPAAFGICLGDLVHDDLSLYERQNRAFSLLGIPWFNLAGNHDLNFDAPNRSHTMDTFKRVFGPTYYSFDYGPVHFVVLDNVAFYKAAEARRAALYTELTPNQMTWLENDLKLVPKDQLVVFLMHIPPVTVFGSAAPSMREVREFFRLIEDRPHTFSISAHTHIQTHAFWGAKEGWHGATEHHHLNHATTCGNWWKGLPDEQGIPHTTMSDGTPNGYSFINFKGNSYTVDFKPARRPASYQMNIFAPDAVPQSQLAQTEVLVNVFAGSQKSTVELQIGDSPWSSMSWKPQIDPGYAVCKTLEDALPDSAFNKLPGFNKSSHIWTASLPTNIPAGTHLLRVRTTDMWGRIFQDSRILTVQS